MATLKLLSLEAEGVNNARLFAEFNHAVCLVVLLRPASILDLASTLETLHKVVEAPLVAHITYDDGATDLLNFTGLIVRRQSWILGKIEFHQLGIVCLDYLLRQLTLYAIDHLWRQFGIRFL